MQFNPSRSFRIFKLTPAENGIVLSLSSSSSSARTSSTNRSSRNRRRRRRRRRPSMRMSTTCRPADRYARDGEQREEVLVLWKAKG